MNQPLNKPTAKIEWLPPEPRHGLRGSWDKFIGPGATASEEWLQLVGGLGLAALLGALLYLRREMLDWNTLQIVVISLIAFDLIGGIITNATSAAKRWYHRPGQEGWRAHLPFIAVHGVHLLVVGALFRDLDWSYFVVFYLYLLIASTVILIFPLYLQRAVSFILFCGALLLGIYLYPPTPGLEWFIPFFFLKLLVSHLVKEAPFAPD